MPKIEFYDGTTAMVPPADKLRIVVPSHLRSDTIGKMTLNYCPEAIVTVNESEVDEYANAGVQNLWPHPDSVKGYGAIMNWILENFEDEAVMILDDDMMHFTSYTSKNTVHYKDPEVGKAIIQNTYQIAIDMQVGLAGWNGSQDPKTFRSFDPVKLTGFIQSGCSIMLGKDVKFDPVLYLREDFDFNLNQLLKKRITFMDHRFCFLAWPNFTGRGGSAEFRSQERDEGEREYMKKKWGQYILFGHRNGAGGSKQAATSVIQVPRGAKI
jgi:hypothetical protein